MLKEFKEFAMKGNLVDIAVGFVMGAAFNKVVTTFTGGIVSPLVGLLLGDVNLEDLKYVLKQAEVGPDGAETAAEVAIMYGSFITSVIDFIIVAFVMFLIVKGVNNMKKKEEEAPAAPPADVVLLEEIRDLLKKK
ncbi:MAG TPA: large-conductance mechanosensitive channel protein MscL [Bacteroidetes bacterium]|nr:large-conductance mechanosensitive channel protein MscL [Bacteroidota bacterium]